MGATPVESGWGADLSAREPTALKGLGVSADRLQAAVSHRTSPLLVCSLRPHHLPIL